MDKIVKKYKQWKKVNPEKGYQYDKIHDFFADLSRGEMLAVMEYLEKVYEEKEK